MASKGTSTGKPAKKGSPTSELARIPPHEPTARLLPLAQVHDENFEYICLKLAECEPDVVQAELKRGRGVDQYGADVEGFSAEHHPILIVSAKRWQRINSSLLREWGRSFVDSFEQHWKSKGVRRFVIAVTVELNDDSLNDTIRSEKQRFKSLGISYEVWGLNQLTNRLRALPRLVATYFHPGWVPIICGASAAKDPFEEAFFVGHWSEFSESLSSIAQSARQWMFSVSGDLGRDELAPLQWFTNLRISPEALKVASYRPDLEALLIKYNSHVAELGVAILDYNRLVRPCSPSLHYQFITLGLMKALDNEYDDSAEREAAKRTADDLRELYEFYALDPGEPLGNLIKQEAYQSDLAAAVTNLKLLVKKMHRFLDEFDARVRFYDVAIEQRGKMPLS